MILVTKEVGDVRQNCSYFNRKNGCIKSDNAFPSLNSDYFEIIFHDILCKHSCYLSHYDGMITINSLVALNSNVLTSVVINEYYSFIRLDYSTSYVYIYWELMSV